MPSTVLFDLDGTLTDPAPGIIGSFRKALAVSATNRRPTKRSAGSSVRRCACPFRR